MRSLSCTSALIAAAFVAACSSSSRDDEKIARIAQPIVSGEAANDDVAWGSVVALLYRPDPNLAVACTGVLVAPNLVITARHCLSDADAGLMVCDAAGEPVEDGSGQGYVKGDHEPSKIAVYLGSTNPDPNTPPAAFGKLSVHDGAATVCSHDLAALVLDRELAGAPLASLHMAAPEVGEHVDVVGFGSTEMLPRPPVRQILSDLEILVVASDIPGQPGSVGPSPSTFSTGAALCNGDSGAPAFTTANNKNGARGLVGIGSRADNRNLNPAESPCAGPQVRSTFMRLSSFSVVVEKAFAASGHEPTFDGPRSIFGTSCKASIECASDVCGPTSLCTSRCTDDLGCPSQHACLTGLCIASSPASSSPPATTVAPPEEPARRPVPSACSISREHNGAYGFGFGFSFGFVFIVITAFGRKRRTQS